MTTENRRTESAVRLTVRANFFSVAMALFVIGIVLLVYQAVSLRSALTDDASLQASVIAENVTASIMFSDEHAAADLMRSLANVPYVESLSVYLTDGRLFSRYARAGISRAEAEEGTLESAAGNRALSLGDVTVEVPIRQNGRLLGFAVLVATSEQVRAQLARYACFLGLASLCAIWISTGLMNRMRRRVARAERELEYLASTDPLTNLPNRRSFYDSLHQRLRVARLTRQQMGVILVDLDDFKTINDSLGHGAGDELLQHVATMLKEASNGQGAVSRMGGDEFAITLDVGTNEAEVGAVAGSVARALGRPVTLAGRDMNVTASVGYCLYPEAGDDAASLVSSADIALYQAKSRGKNMVVRFSPEMTDAARRRAYLEAELRKALDNDALQLFYQPQFSCTGGALVGAEALARWTHPLEGVVSPAEFIPIAEHSDLIVALGRWVLQHACVAAATWNAAAGADRYRVAVNVSARQLRHPSFLPDVAAALRLSGLAPAMLELELTESFLIANMSMAIDTMQRLRAIGVSLSLDDFGTGYSSLSYLHAFPVNTLKIDRSFVERLPDEGRAIVTAILSMAHSFDLEVVAEGVEHPAQLEWLIDAGCDIVQGFLTGRPMPLEQFRELVRHPSAPLPASKALTSQAG
ncbi:putative bifunctional diguanylate cyclase/phosphodiesterase [Paraburkholderia phosphatilytica]|uniref:putative bifunctional diguanylate cyclase/phosphodiesterase n=1 Tax=Paraburkholderia phosphatilytica TaxID=2282883 RepID=UPI001F0BE59A|nr:EAL domain-containing protein [Paraburkholderia phosphatilytica]